MTEPCEQLADFLEHDLAGDEHGRFLGHLPRCAECRAAVSAEERLNNLLIDAVKSEPLPRGVMTTVERRFAGRRRWRVAGTMAAVAASLAAIWLVGRPRPLPVEIDRPRIDDAPAVAAVSVKFPAGNVIAVTEPIEAPNVTFLWVHPTLSRNSEGSLP